MSNKVPSLGILGNGFIGSAVSNAFLHYTDVKVFDLNPARSHNSYLDVINQDIIFLCLPTPMNKDGSVDCSIVEAALKKISDNLPSGEPLKPVLIKSTIPPFQLGSLMLQFGEKLLLIFNPEFLTERSAQYEYIQSNRFIFGTLKEFNETPEAQLVVDLFNHRFPAVPQYWRIFSEASLVKYFTNMFFATKVALMNEFAQVAESWGLNHNDIMSLVMLDPRIGRSHFLVPGTDGQKGYGGSCLEKTTKIFTEHEVKNISDIQIGNFVFDGQNFTKVSAVNTRVVPDYIELVIRGIRTKGSNDHIHMVINQDNKLEQKLFKNLTLKDWVFFPKPDLSNSIMTFYMPPKPARVKWWPKSVTIDASLARVLGLYLAEGFCGKYYSKSQKKYEYNVKWCFGFDEEHFADEVVSVLSTLGLVSDKKYVVSERATFGPSRTWVVRVRSKGFYTFLHDVLKLGNNARNKNTPLFTGDVARALVGGWLDGDGNYTVGTVSGFSRSKTLISKIFTMITDQGILPAVSNKGQQINISMRENVEKICKWTSRFKFDPSRYVRNFAYESPTVREVENGWSVNISEINQINEPLEVVSIETESELYVANNMLTHNCFLKDTNGFIHLAKEAAVDPLLAKAAWRKNLEVRGVVNIMEYLNSVVGRASSEKMTVDDIVRLGE